MIALCGAPETHSSVKYSSFNSTSEGSIIAFRCHNDVLFDTEEFTSECLRNASWIPDPIRQCSGVNLQSGIEVISCN